MAATASCVMAMGHIEQSKPGWGLSKSVALRCAIVATWAPRRKSASPRRSCRSGARRTKSLDAPLPVLYLLGVSTGDFQEALAALLGKDAPNLSPAVISRLTAEWQADYDAWQKRDLSARRYVYVWADGVYLQARMEEAAECMLVLNRRNTRRQEGRKPPRRCLTVGGVAAQAIELIVVRLLLTASRAGPDRLRSWRKYG
jgi:Transposase, Mutator family